MIEVKEKVNAENFEVDFEHIRLYGGYSYNKYGEAIFDADDDDDEDDMYNSMVTPEEIEACRQRMMEARKYANI